MGRRSMKKTSSRIAAALLSFVLLYTGCLLLLGNGKLYLNNVIAEDILSSEGKLNYSDGSFYEGEVLYGRIRTGSGSFTWSTGETYEGSWENDMQTGEGKMVWPGLGVYEGQFVNGKREGKGTFTWTYDGEPEAGQPLSYQGEWTNDQIGPTGTITFAELGIYEGEFSKNARNGNGSFTWDNGDQYYGTWQNDQINGTGVFTAADGTLLEGTFAKNVLSKGTATYAVDGGKATRDIQGGKTQASVTIVYDNGTIVSGKLKGDEFTGNVSISYPSGDTYVGTISAGVKSGKGTYTWSNGAHYTGDWVADKMSGSGKYFYGSDESNTYLTGTFSNGLPSGTLTYISEKKLKYETIWSNGECTSIKYKR